MDTFLFLVMAVSGSIGFALFALGDRFDRDGRTVPAMVACMGIAAVAGTILLLSQPDTYNVDFRDRPRTRESRAR